MLIANPIYDVVFKYLLKDKKVAKLLLSAIIGEDIVEIDFRSTEKDLEIKSWTVIRIDFAAKIKTENGDHKLVIIEIQKAKLPSDVMRFRQYLGTQYRDKNNSIKVPKKNSKLPRTKALPILSLYFLGHPLEHTKVPVIKVERKYFDLSTNEEILVKEEFIESLTHDSFVVQIPSLKGKRRTELEQILSVFDQDNQTTDKHILNFKEEDLPNRYRPILRRLIAAASDQKVRDTMEAEDQLVKDFEDLERESEEIKKENEEFKKENEEQKKEIEEKSKALNEERKEKQEAFRIIEELKKQLKDKDK